MRSALNVRLANSMQVKLMRGKPFQQSRMELSRLLHLRCMAEAGKFDQRRLWNQFGSLFSKQLVSAQFCSCRG